MKVDESSNSRWCLTANSHPLSSTLNCFKFWWELMRVVRVWPVMRVDESCNSRWRLTANSHPLSPTVTDFELVWWELMWVCARLTSHESWWELQNCHRFALCSSRLSKTVQNLQLRKITGLVWVTSTLINSHLVSPAHESWENSRANSRFSTLINSHPRLTRSQGDHDTLLNMLKVDEFIKSYDYSECSHYIMKGIIILNINVHHYYLISNIFTEIVG